MYYVLWAGTDDDGRIMGVAYDSDHRARNFNTGRKFSDDPDAKPWLQHPKEPIRIDIEPGNENHPMPSFLEMPVPLMRTDLLEAIKSAGVNNMDAYKAELYYPDGRLASNDYFVVNIVGLVSAADMDKSVYDPDQPDKMIAASFDSLTIDECKAHGFLMFRLAENVTTVIIHEIVKEAIENAGIELIRISKTENVALL